MNSKLLKSSSPEKIDKNKASPGLCTFSDSKLLDKKSCEYLNCILKEEGVKDLINKSFSISIFLLKNLVHFSSSILLHIQIHSLISLLLLVHDTNISYLMFQD